MPKEDDIMLTCGHRNRERVKALKEFPSTLCPACLLERIKALEIALNTIWPFIEDDFPKGTGDNHGTCATDLYLLAARGLEKALRKDI